MSTTSPSRAESRKRFLADAHVGFLRVILMSEVLRVVKHKRLSAMDVTGSLGVPAERVSALLHRDTDQFTLDDLVRMLARAEVEVKLTKSSPVDEVTFDG